MIRAHDNAIHRWHRIHEEFDKDGGIKLLLCVARQLGWGQETKDWMEACG